MCSHGAFAPATNILSLIGCPCATTCHFMIGGWKVLIDPRGRPTVPPPLHCSSPFAPELFPLTFLNPISSSLLTLHSSFLFVPLTSSAFPSLATSTYCRSLTHPSTAMEGLLHPWFASSFVVCASPQFSSFLSWCVDVCGFSLCQACSRLYLSLSSFISAQFCDFLI